MTVSGFTDARATLTMAGSTTFHFVMEGIHVALDRAREAANGGDVRLGERHSCRALSAGPLTVTHNHTIDRKPALACHA
jgi:hypothetical protein